MRRVTSVPKVSLTPDAVTRVAIPMCNLRKLFQRLVRTKSSPHFLGLEVLLSSLAFPAFANTATRTCAGAMQPGSNRGNALDMAPISSVAAHAF
jgi:hypothetical protein